MIHDIGGTKALRSFNTEVNKDGNRLYTEPCACDMMKEGSATSLKALPLLFFSLYCDGTLLSRSGAVEGVILRIRIDNVAGGQERWYDIGIVPELLTDDYKGRKSDLPLLRSELFQRFLFLVLHNASHHSQNCWASYGFEPRLLYILCDQPQEKVFSGLYRSRGKRPCTICRVCSSGAPGTNAEARNVSTLVSAQLECAVMDRLLCNWPFIDGIESLYPSPKWESFMNMPLSYKRKRHAYVKQFLKQESARSFPQALAVLYGIGTTGGRLHDLLGFDKLHGFDLGVGRYFGDNLFRMLRCASIRGRLSRERWIIAANRRIAELPANTGVRGLSPFKLGESDKQASFTGRHRRLLVPFQFHVVIGLNGSCNPDDDIITQTALGLDFLHSVLEGSNRSIEEFGLCEGDLNRMHLFTVTIFSLMRKMFGLSMSKKLHWLEAHLTASLRHFRHACYTDTGANESLHWKIKSCYKASNKRKRGIGQQLLKVNIAAEILESITSNSEVRNHRNTLSTENPLIICEAELRSKRPLQTSENHEELDQQLLIASSVNQRISNLVAAQSSITNEEVLKRLCSFTVSMISGNTKLEVLQTADIAASIESDTETTFVREKLYSRHFQRSKASRYHSVSYATHPSYILSLPKSSRFDRIGECVAFIRRESTFCNNCVVALLRPMASAEPQPGNARIVTEFGFERLQFVYEANGSYFVLHCVPLLCIGCRLNVIRDICDIVSRRNYPRTTLISDLPCNSAERKEAFFFHVRTAKVISHM
ncbi:hypothetical protein FGB62_15g07 [Gracilaria domingensis]|nr:hypothetical protein FGB62_15g07 [Gracilaria domingensis]